MFVGVVALAATVIGYLYTDVSRPERIAFGVAAVLLMAPEMILQPLAAIIGSGQMFNIGARLKGGVIFAALTGINHRSATTVTPEKVAAP